MNIPNYDNEQDTVTNYKQLYSYMPRNNFRMLITGPSGCGKTNALMHMFHAPLIYLDKLFLYAKNLEQSKYQDLINKFNEISHKVGYNVIECSNDEILPVSDLDNESQKVIIFDDFVCEKNQAPIIDYFIRGRHKNCSVIYLSQSYYKTPKDIRLNCSHFCVYEFPAANERGLITRELGASKEQYNKATHKPYSFLYVDKPDKKIARNFYGKI